MKLRITRNHYERLKRCAGWVDWSVGDYARLRWKHRAAEAEKNAPEDEEAVDALLAESPREVVMTIPDCEAPADELIRVLAETVARVERIMRRCGKLRDEPPEYIEGRDYYIAGRRYPGVGLVE